MEKICAVDGCDRPTVARGWCVGHYNRWHRTGDVGSPELTKFGPSHYMWKGNEVSYAAAHQRISRRRGRATDHLCEHCGAEAEQWAYDHRDPAELVSDRGRPYSTNPDRYISLCTSCHIKFDQPHEASPCSAERCTSQAVARGWCKKHWKRWRKHGDPTVTLIERSVVK